MGLPRFADLGNRWQNMDELPAIVVVDSLHEHTDPVLMAEADKDFAIADMYCTNKDCIPAPSRTTTPVRR